MKLFKFTKRLLNNQDKKLIVLSFLAWRIWITVFALFGAIFLPLKSAHLLGGGLENYTQNPIFWGWANFDGEHYLRIAQYGYQPLTHAFFPLYPALVHYMGSFFGFDFSTLVFAGLLISNATFFVSLFLFWELICFDYSKKIARVSLVSLLVFPTSFYFGALYTESLFFLLTVAAFYCLRKDKWIFAGILGGLSTATRLVGIFLLPAMVLELRQCRREKGAIQGRQIFSLILVLLGLVFYMLFLRNATGDSFAFYHLQQLSGEQRTQELILLPQVFWRYIKMLVTVTKSDPIYLTILLEATVGVLGLFFIVWGYMKRARPSYLLFLFLGYILPTLTGSFSSLPRYALTLFPLFVFFGLFLASRGRMFKMLSVAVSVILLAIETVLFIRGYWVA